MENSMADSKVENRERKRLSLLDSTFLVCRVKGCKSAGRLKSVKSMFCSAAESRMNWSIAGEIRIIK